MYCTMTPISSMWPSSMIVTAPPALTSAMLLPATSTLTFSAKVSASARQARAAAVSNPEGAGASRRRFRKVTEDGLSIGDGREGGAVDTDANPSPPLGGQEVCATRMEAAMQLRSLV